MESSTPRCLCITLVASLFFLPTHAAFASSLGNFEKAATQPRKESPQNTASEIYEHDHDDDDCDRDQALDINCTKNDLLGEILFFPLTLMGEGMALMAAGSLERERGADEGTRNPLRLRKKHDRDIPHLALDLNQHRLDAETYGTGIRMETGWGPIGLEADTLRYRQQEPAASLDISHAHLLWRGSQQDVQLNLGVGTIFMNGQENNSGPSVLGTLSMFPTQELAIDFRGTHSWINGNRLADYDGSLAWGHHGYAFRAGYRYSTVSDESLRGPYLGFSWRY